MTSNNLEAIELLYCALDDLRADSEQVIPEAVQDIKDVLALLQADEVQEKCCEHNDSWHTGPRGDCSAYQCPCSVTAAHRAETPPKPTKLDKEEVWKKAQAAAKTFDKPTKETKLRRLQGRLKQQVRAGWTELHPAEVEELIDILVGSDD